MIRSHLLPLSLCPRSRTAIKSFATKASATPDVTVLKEATGSPVQTAGGEHVPAVRQLLFHRNLTHMVGINVKLLEPRQTWIDNFENTDPQDKRGLIQLHPLIFSTYPRVDLIKRCIQWQMNYREVDWTTMMTRSELHPMGPRPWPQKGTGRARHKDKRSPLWIDGGWTHPPRGPKSKYYTVRHDHRVMGLTGALAAKFAQNDMIVVDSLEDFPHTEPEEMKQFLNDRNIGPSVLIVDVGDMFPRNISLASEAVPYVNLMPVYGLNVYSMLKHETLVMTVAALQLAEERLLFNLTRSDAHKCSRKYNPPPVCQDRDPHLELPTTEYLTGDVIDLH